MKAYQLSIKNKSGKPQNIALFLVANNIVDGSLAVATPSRAAISWDESQLVQNRIWQHKLVENGNYYTFKWDLNWGLGWETTNTKKDPIPVIPDPNGSKPNSMMVGYTKDSTGGDFYSDGYINKNLKSGELGIETTNEFSTTTSEDLYLTISVDEKIAFTVHGNPSTAYIISTDHTYYITASNTIGQDMPMSLIRRFTQLEQDTNDWNCTLNDNRLFSCQASSPNHEEL